MQLINHVREFLIEMGGDFAFVGNQYHLLVGSRDLYIDLLLFHRRLRSLVAIEFLITTAGTDTHSICYETHQKALDILKGRKHDSTFYPVIYGADEADDWTDPKVWKKANP